MSYAEYGPLAFLIGTWTSKGHSGQNRAPDPDRAVENSKFRQETTFTPAGEVANHEQILYALEYKTLAWEEGLEDEPFHQEIGYWLWDPANKQLMKSFVIPRGVTVIAGATVDSAAKEYSLSAKLGSETYGICSNIFLDQEFQTVKYDLKITYIDENTFSYDENSQLKIKGQNKIFDHIEKNTMVRS